MSNKALVIGDSIGYELPIYVDQYNTEIGATWVMVDGCHGGYRCINIYDGYAPDSMPSLENRLLTNTDCTRVLIGLGANDFNAIGSINPIVGRRYARLIIEKVLAHNYTASSICWFECIPCGAYSFSMGARKQWEYAMNWLRVLYGIKAASTFFKLKKIATGIYCDLAVDAYDADHVHLNDAGCKVWAALVTHEFSSSDYHLRIGEKTYGAYPNQGNFDYWGLTNASLNTDKSLAFQSGGIAVSPVWYIKASQITLPTITGITWYYRKAHNYYIMDDAAAWTAYTVPFTVYGAGFVQLKMVAGMAISGLDGFQITVDNRYFYSGARSAWYGI